MSRKHEQASGITQKHTVEMWTCFSTVHAALVGQEGCERSGGAPGFAKICVLLEIPEEALQDCCGPIPVLATGDLVQVRVTSFE
jgi:hypothetical protein